jgi:hypothetical protein
MRCSKCLIPAFLKGSKFDSNNECIWCQSNYPDYFPQGEAKLKELIKQYRDPASVADCLVGISGGKDSSFALMELKKLPGIRVEAFTYIHEGSTPFAFENAKELCKKLDVKHHVLTLPGQAHLKSFKDFFTAWTRHPSNVAAAMSCVACKHMYKLGAELASERKIPMAIWADCPLEKFPLFLAASEQENVKEYKRVGLLESSWRLAKEMRSSMPLSLGVIKYFNLCFHGCLGSNPLSTYMSVRFPKLRHVFFFEYYNWNPPAILNKLVSEIGWKPPEKLATDWHSDCAFTIFKDYMFRKMYGIGPLEAFLSNKIRHGIISREEGMNTLRNAIKQSRTHIIEALEGIGLGELAGNIDLSVYDRAEQE